VGGGVCCCLGQFTPLAIAAEVVASVVGLNLWSFREEKEEEEGIFIF
jgi:hypothetical protein